MRNVIFLMIGAALLFAGPAYTADQHDTVGRLSLSATGTVDAVPDLATLNAGVVTEAKTATHERRVQSFKSCGHKAKRHANIGLECIADLHVLFQLSTQK